MALPVVLPIVLLQLGAALARQGGGWASCALPILGQGPSQELLLRAESLLRATKSTKYAHRQYIDEKAGVCETDCSGLVSFLLNEVAPKQYALIPKEADRKFVRARGYFDFFASLSATPVAGWQAVTDLAKAPEGALLAWSLPEDAADTGHVMVLTGPAIKQENGEFLVPVIDSSVLHHTEDSRPKGTNGVGRGKIWISVDPSGKPIGFHFSKKSNLHLVPIAMAALAPSQI